jgi:Tfp pilus assembly protein PilW
MISYKNKLVYDRISHGFLLLEFLIYLALGSFMVVASVTIIAVIAQRWVPLMHYCRNTAVLLSACRFLDSMLSQAPASTGYWKKITDKELIWVHNAAGLQEDYALYLDKDRLMFAQGSVG